MVSSSPQNDKVGTILAERGKSHGDFTDHARCTQRLKQVVKEEREKAHGSGPGALSPVYQEALDMILHKIGRIVAGTPDFNDHWDDIAGYARLVSDRISAGTVE